MLLETEEGIWARADAQVFRLLMDGGRTERRLRAAERTVAAAFRRVAALRERRRAGAAREQAAADRRLDQELSRAWGRPMRIRMAKADRPTSVAVTASRKMAMLAGASKRAIRTYRVPLADERGRVALFFRVRYVGFKSKTWRAGLAADHALYILRDEALERVGDVEVDSVPMSNMGTDAHEIAACWRALEDVEEGYRANAIVQHRIIWNLPHDLNAAERRALVEEFCGRTFGRLGLPWVAAIHTPDAKGDQRNYHAHVCFSLRPCERTGDHEWAIAQEKLNGLTDPDGLKLMRALATAHMNRACRATGRPERFTHQTYQERGIDARRQAHVGAAAMAAHERGEHVHSIARNAVIAESNELAVEKARSTREVQALDRLTSLLDRQMLTDRSRNRVAAMTARARTIARSARDMVDWLRRGRSAARPVARHAAPMVRDHARSIMERLQRGRTLRQPSTVRGTAMPLASMARPVAQRIGTVPAPIMPSSAAIARSRHIAIIATGRTTSSTLNRNLAAQRAEAAAIHQRLVALDRQDSIEQARRLILTTEPAPYRLEHNRLVLDLSSMSTAGRQVIEGLPRDDLGHALRERYRLDQQREAEQRKAADAAAKRDEAERAAEVARRTLVEEACRILRDTEPRPYRRSDKRIEPDWSALPERERSTVIAVGIGDDDLLRALIERARRDERVDRTAAMLDVIEQERRHVPSFDGRRKVDPRTLAAFGLGEEDVQTAPVQRELEDIAAQQLGEIRMITVYSEAHPRQLVRVEAGWSLDKAAPNVMRELVEAWQHDDRVQAVLGGLAEREGTVAASPGAPPHIADTLPTSRDQLDEPPIASRMAVTSDTVRPISSAPTGAQKERVEDLGDRARRIRGSINNPGDMSR